MSSNHKKRDNLKAPQQNGVIHVKPDGTRVVFEGFQGDMTHLVVRFESLGGHNHTETYALQKRAVGHG